MIPIVHIFGSSVLVTASPAISAQAGEFVVPFLTFLALSVGSVVLVSFVGTRVVRLWLAN